MSLRGFLLGFFWGGGVVKYSPWVLVNYQAKYIQIFFFIILSVFTWRTQPK